MKKFLFSFLFLTAVLALQAGAGTSSIARAVSVSKASPEKAMPSFIDSDQNVLEIEDCNVSGGSFLKTNPAPQKSPDQYLYNFRKILISVFPSFKAGSALVELFGNTYLSHNYPSHNLW